MKNLLETNIYDAKGKILICGTCLQFMQSKGYKKIIQDYDDILFLCLEKDHINMAITKVCGMLSTGKVSSITFASVNKSPHCTQLHYIKNEVKRVMDSAKLPEMKNIIVQDNETYEISDECLSISKDLVRLQEKLND